MIQLGNREIGQAYITVPVNSMYLGNNLVWNVGSVSPCSYDDWWWGTEANCTNSESYSVQNIPFNGNLLYCTYIKEAEFPNTVPNLYILGANSFLKNYPGTNFEPPFPIGKRCYENSMYSIGQQANNLQNITNMQFWYEQDAQQLQWFQGQFLHKITNCYLAGMVYLGNKTLVGDIHLTDSKFKAIQITAGANNRNVYLNNVFVLDLNVQYNTKARLEFHDSIVKSNLVTNYGGVDAWNTVFNYQTYFSNGDVYLNNVLFNNYPLGNSIVVYAVGVYSGKLEADDVQGFSNLQFLISNVTGYLNNCRNFNGMTIWSLPDNTSYNIRNSIVNELSVQQGKIIATNFNSNYINVYSNQYLNVVDSDIVGVNINFQNYNGNLFIENSNIISESFIQTTGNARFVVTNSKWDMIEDLNISGQMNIYTNNSNLYFINVATELNQEPGDITYTGGELRCNYYSIRGGDSLGFYTYDTVFKTNLYVNNMDVFSSRVHFADGCNYSTGVLHHRGQNVHYEGGFVNEVWFYSGRINQQSYGVINLFNMQNQWVPQMPDLWHLSCNILSIAPSSVVLTPNYFRYGNFNYLQKLSNQMQGYNFLECTFENVLGALFFLNVTFENCNINFLQFHRSNVILNNCWNINTIQFGLQNIYSNTDRTNFTAYNCRANFFHLRRRSNYGQGVVGNLDHCVVNKLGIELSFLNINNSFIGNYVTNGSNTPYGNIYNSVFNIIEFRKGYISFDYLKFEGEETSLFINHVLSNIQNNSLRIYMNNAVFFNFSRANPNHYNEILHQEIMINLLPAFNNTLINFNNLFGNSPNLTTVELYINHSTNWFSGNTTQGIWATNTFRDCINLTGNGQEIARRMGYVGNFYNPTNEVLNTRFANIFNNCTSLIDYSIIPDIFK